MKKDYFILTVIAMVVAYLAFSAIGSWIVDVSERTAEILAK